MKEKIFSALKTKFRNLGFSAKAIEGVAESLAATGLVNDENLDAIVEGQKSALSAMQAEIDRRVTSAVEEAKAEANKNATPADGGGQQRTEPNGNNNPRPFDPAAFEDRMKSLVQATIQPFLPALHDQWEKIGECRCYADATVKLVSGNGEVFRSKCHIVYKGEVISEGVYVKCVDKSSGVTRRDEHPG